MTESLRSDSKPPFDEWRRDTSPERLSRALFDGALIHLRDLEPIERLARRARTLVEEIFETADPARAEAHMTPADFRQAAVRARKAIEKDAEVDHCWRESLAAIGYRPENCWLDRIKLRVVPARKETHGRVIRPLPPHRDTWGSGIMAQVNWWLPLYPLAAGRTMLLWPRLFREPIQNDSGEWDYDALMLGDREDYPLLPVATKTPAEPGLPVLIEPGSLIAFSAAHVHGSTAAGSDLCRFSIDTRSAWAGDVRAGRGAPDVDGNVRRIRWEWFSRPTAPIPPSRRDRRPPSLG